MSNKRNKVSGTKSCKCDVCNLVEPSTVEGTKHRRCGGGDGAPVRAKHTRGDVRGYWR